MTLSIEPSGPEDNGWQIPLEDVKMRISALFNSYTMSDVVLNVDGHSIPAHKFVLASASPVFYEQLYEDHRDGAPILDGIGSDRGHDNWWEDMMESRRVLVIENVSAEALLEFLQFLYSDGVDITLDNVLHLMFLADMYKVAGLVKRCLVFLSSQVAPHSALRVLRAVRSVLLKSIMEVWWQAVEEEKILKKFRALPLAARRAQLQEMIEQFGAGRRSLAGSRCPSRGSSAVHSRATSVDSGSEGSSDGMRFANEDLMPAMDFDGGFDRMAGMARATLTGNAEQLMTRNMPGHGDTNRKQRVAAIREVTSLCWRCIQTDTKSVLATPEFFDEDLPTLREILRLQTCTVPEISFFRAAHEWSKRRCEKLGLESTVQQKRAQLGKDTLLLIRFPTMTLEQFQWEVVPTGLLPHEDVQQLLRAIGQKQHNLHRFVATPRNTISEQVSRRTKGRSIEDARQQEERSLYQAAPGCPLDAILAGELLRSAYRHAEGEAPVTSTAPASSGNVLPRIARPGEASRCRGQMVLGLRIDAEEAHGRLLKHGGALPQPQDFVRLGTGLYRFRGDRLVELWLEDGRPVVRDHGPLKLSPSADFSTLQEQALRTAVGLASGPPLGMGVPLISFLCRQ